MIILEGPDNSGKTTLAQVITDRLDLQYCRPPSLSSTKGADDGVFKWWDDQLAMPFEVSMDNVYDRCTYISDVIYRTASAQAPLRVEGMMQRGINRLVAGNTHIIFCLPEWEWSLALHMKERSEGGGLNWATIDDLRVIHWAYYCTYTLYRWAMPRRVTMFDPQRDTYQGLYDEFLKPYMANRLEIRRASRV